jgi:hypothetical protein
MPARSTVPANAKYTRQDIADGTKHELEHTRDRRQARVTAIQHLNKHRTYYKVLPMAEQFMALQENKKPVRPKRRKQAPSRHPYVSGLPAWGRQAF